MTLNRLVFPAFALLLGATGLASLKASPLPQAGISVQLGGGWDAPPQDLQDVQRRGFHDGIEGARKDFDNRRRPDVNNRDEYRHPSVSRHDRGAYRDGFRRGYNVAVSHMMGGHDHDNGFDHDRDHDHDHN